MVVKCVRGMIKMWVDQVVVECIRRMIKVWVDQVVVDAETWQSGETGAFVVWRYYVERRPK